MQVVSARPLGDPKAGMYRIELSDGSLFSIKSVYIPPEYCSKALCVADKVLSSQEEKALRFAASCVRAEGQALRLVARAEQNSRGLSHKFKQRGHAAPCIQRVVARLIEQAIVSDYRYAQMWLRARLARRLESPRYLITALCSRGIDRATAEEALLGILDGDTEWAMLHQYLEKNHPIRHGSMAAIRQKLKYEGFSSTVIDRLAEGAG
ncbi:MAG: recombination regulator RecX [Treponema sp.]|jgi:SOS response regulatory protein OraA/RecX|nr:recombination regulator RecX [Treponema sp.]